MDFAPRQRAISQGYHCERISGQKRNEYHGITTVYQSIEDIKENSWRKPKLIPENALKKCFDTWL